MRVSVASTGGGAGCGGWGLARSRSALYSSTGSTTQPSGETGGACAAVRVGTHSAHTPITITSRARVIASSFNHGAGARDDADAPLVKTPTSNQVPFILRRRISAIG